MPQSAVDFPTPTRFHMGLTVSDIDASRAFYEQLLDMKPTKLRPKYVKFESHDPPINLTLNEERSRASGKQRCVTLRDPGEVDEAVAKELARLDALGLVSRIEDDVTCCHAVQDKVWVTDPDGNDWEIFVVTQADAPAEANTHGEDACCASESSGPCC